MEPWRSTPRHGSVPDIRSETNGGEKDYPGNAARDGGPAGVSGGREGSGAAGSGMGRGRPVRGGAALGPVRPGDDPPGGGMVWRPVLVRRRRPAGQAGKPPSSVRRGPVGSDLRPVCQSVAPAVEHTGPRSADGNSNGGLAGDGGVFRWDIRHVGGAFPAGDGRPVRLSGRVGSGAGLHSGPLPQKDALCPGGTAGVRSTADGGLSPAHIGGCAVRPGDPPGGGLV